nr:unnamed protein product [Digitaria exilis]
MQAPEQQPQPQPQQRRKGSTEMDFFSEYGDANRYKIQEVIGKGSYGVVCSAVDQHTGDKVAIKKIHNIFEHLSDTARILREIKLLRLLRHPDIVEIKHIMLPPSRRDFKDIYVVFELMDTDLHQVIKANDDLTREHHQFFLYQMLRALKYIHTGKPLFPGKNVVHQLDLMTDLLGTPSLDTVSRIRNEKARSAVDNFRRQFTNLEENGGKSGAHIPSSDRKHVSLPRTTTVHSNPIPPNGSSQVPQRIPTARPGRVVGPVIPYENLTAVDPYNKRRVARNPVLPPATSNLSAYSYHRKSDNSDRELQQELEKDRMQYQPAQRFMDAKVVPQMSPDLRSAYYIPKGAPKSDVVERAALQPSMIHGIAPFSGIAAVGGGGYNKVNAVQYGVSRMY